MSMSRLSTGTSRQSSSADYSSGKASASSYLSMTRRHSDAITTLLKNLHVEETPTEAAPPIVPPRPSFFFRTPNKDSASKLSTKKSVSDTVVTPGVPTRPSFWRKIPTKTRSSNDNVKDGDVDCGDVDDDVDGDVSDNDYDGDDEDDGDNDKEDEHDRNVARQHNNCWRYLRYAAVALFLSGIEYHVTKLLIKDADWDDMGGEVIEELKITFRKVGDYTGVIVGSLALICCIVMIGCETTFYIDWMKWAVLTLSFASIILSLNRPTYSFTLCMFLGGTLFFIGSLIAPGIAEGEDDDDVELSVFKAV